ncbi:hypothetical protein MYX06_04135 [Patescibacteria group bacterium AH-259-L05]|nr:hypothetical protein [Patescibacteria group bacterium AH-259-L05]
MEFLNSNAKGKGSGKRSFPVGVIGANEVSDTRGRKPYGEYSSRALASDYVHEIEMWYNRKGNESNETNFSVNVYVKSRYHNRYRSWLWRY